MRTAARRSPAISRAAARPSRPGILMSRMARSGSSSRDELDRLVAAAGLAHDLVALLLEGLLEVEADDGLVFGDHDADGHGGRSFGGSPGDSDEPVEQLVLGSLELLDRRDDLRPGCGPWRRRGAAPRGARSAERRLRHQGPKPRLVGGLGEEGQLLVDDRELCLRALQPLGARSDNRRSSNQRDMGRAV